MKISLKKRLKLIVPVLIVAAVGLGVSTSLQVSKTNKNVDLLALSSAVAQTESNCVSCDNKNDKVCQKVIVGNTTHIFNGPKSDCE